MAELEEIKKVVKREKIDLIDDVHRFRAVGTGALFAASDCSFLTGQYQMAPSATIKRPAIMSSKSSIVNTLRPKYFISPSPMLMKVTPVRMKERPVLARA